MQSVIVAKCLACSYSMAVSQGRSQAEEMPKCLVKGCRHSSGRKSSVPGVALHPFPRDLALIKKWLLQMNQEFGDLDLFAQGILQGRMGVSRICSVHFAPECYSLVGSEKVLLEGAVPTIFPDRDKPAARTETAASPLLLNLVLPLGLWTNNVSMAPGIAPLGVNITPVNNTATIGFNEREKSPTTSFGKSFHPDKLRGNLPGVSLQMGTKTGAVFPNLPSGKVNKAVQWPEYEHNVNGEAWKVLHDHYYRVPSGSRYQARNQYSHLSDYMSEYGFMSYSGDSYWENELFSMLQCVANFVAVNRSNNLRTARILKQALGIISMLTGEEWVTVNKNTINKGVQQLTGEFPVKCDDVAVYFTTDEWSYINQHRMDYQDFLTDDNPTNHKWDAPEHWDFDIITVEEVEELEKFDDREELEKFDDREELEKFDGREELEKFDDREEFEEEEEDMVNVKKKVDSSDWEPDSEGELESDVEYEDGSDKAKEDDKSAVKLEEPPIPHPCDQCEECFADLETLKTHKMTHVEKCENCEEVLDNKAELIKHRAENHAVKRYACTICGIEYDYKSQFIIHQRAHTGEKPFECNECGAKFGYRSTLLVHERRHAMGKLVECSKCDKRFDKRSEMTKHMKKVHETKKIETKKIETKKIETKKIETKKKKNKFKCPKCWKFFAHRGLLRNHEWEHDDD